MIMWRAATMSMNKCVRPGQRASSTVRTWQKCLTIFPQVTDEQNSASVKLVTITFWMQLFGTFAFIGSRGIPSMHLEHVVDVGLAAQLHSVSSLEDVSAIALLVKTTFSFNALVGTFSLDTFVDLGEEEFSSVWRLSTDCKIINLAAD